MTIIHVHHVLVYSHKCDISSETQQIPLQFVFEHINSHTHITLYGFVFYWRFSLDLKRQMFDKYLQLVFNI